MEKLINQLIKIEEEISLAFNQNDLDGLLGYFDKEIVGFSSTIHERYSGLTELRRTFEFYLGESGKMEYFTSSPVVQIHECTAILSFYWTVAILHGASRHEVGGRGTHVFVDKGDNNWKIVHEHLSREHHDR
ncbi:MAG: nuclear transport factor 2 family protein [Bacteroidales bacterium]|nr:nuclear transport factor 2 family protein [Bacteroidales bacterium]